jgi:hypothetical protein
MHLCYIKNNFHLVPLVIHVSTFGNVDNIQLYTTKFAGLLSIGQNTNPNNNQLNE